MKALRYLVVAVLAFTTLFSYSQNGINYKALVKDGSGNAVTSTTIAVQFQVLKGGAMTNVYQETHNPTTDTNGYVIVNIGTGSVDSGVFTDIDWSSDEHHLNVQIDTGSGLVDLGTAQFMAVPYALSVSPDGVKINDLADGKSDNDGTDDGSSVYLGLNAGAQDDGTNNGNVGIGFQSLYSNSFGSQNIAIGWQSLTKNTIGSGNCALGHNSLKFNTTGSLNTASGRGALYDNTSGDGNTATGSSALFLNRASYNTATGSLALRYNTTGAGNTAHGALSLFTNTTGNNNTANGMEALNQNSTGSYN
ncbi:MAG: hypothetical protein KJO49_04865, partial [Bacteroidia bacterium]|nr:hypothetical protein [Bacteroidia bacterium]